jgi:hypothetical protein
MPFSLVALKPSQEAEMTVANVLSVTLKDTKATILDEAAKLANEKVLLVEACEKLTRDNEELQKLVNDLTEKNNNLITVCNDYKAELDHLAQVEVSDDTTDETGMPTATPIQVVRDEFCKRMGIRAESELWAKLHIKQEHDRFVLWFDSEEWGQEPYNFMGRLRKHALGKGFKANFQQGKGLVIVAVLNRPAL